MHTRFFSRKFGLAPDLDLHHDPDRELLEVPPTACDLPGYQKWPYKPAWAFSFWPGPRPAPGYSRNAAIKCDFQDDIVTVNEIYKRMADIVEDQGDMVTSIEFNIESTSVQVTDGTEQLRQAGTFKVNSLIAISLLFRP